MSTSVSMPALGESVSEGTVTRWLKQEGDQVEADEPLLEVSTDKVDTEIPSPAAGVLQKILVGEDETVAVGAELAVIGDGGGGGSDADGTTDDAAAGGAAAEQQQPTDAGEEPQQSDQPADQAQQSDQPSDQAQQSDQPAEQSSGNTQTEEPQSEQNAQPTTEEQTGSEYPAAPGNVAQPTEQPQESDVSEEASSGGESGSSGGGASGSTGGGTPVTMPALGESVTEGTITRWLKQEGEQVAADEALLEVSTDKVDTEIPSPSAGVLQKILVGEDETVAVGTELAMIGGASDGDQPQAQEAPAPAAQEQQPEEQAQPQQDQQAQPQQDQQTAQQPSHQAQQPAQQPNQQAQQQVQQSPQQPPQQEKQPQQASSQQDGSGDGDASAYVTPLVRKLASEHGVDLSSLTGTGVGGRIRKQDVLEAAAQREQQKSTASDDEPAERASEPAAAGLISPLRGTTEKMSRLRKVIAQRMVESLQVSAQLTTVVEVDLTRIARLRARAKSDFEAREHVKLSFLPFLAKATIEGLKSHPKLNASVDIEAGEITYYDAEHLGVAVDTERGLLVPVVKNAGDLNIAGLARKVADLAERTRNNKITPDELGGGTFTLTNTGSRGALFDTPIINQPQVGILGTGAVVKRPVVVDDPDLGETIAIRSMCYLALSYDHRVVDGADAARFLTTVKQRLEEGKFEGDLGL